jgi:hypothetical protein
MRRQLTTLDTAARKRYATAFRSWSRRTCR